MDFEEGVKAVRRMQEYIGEHISQPMTSSQLARAAGYSPYRSGRLFKEHTGKTPFEYIRAMRLSQAALLPRDGKPKIADVAFELLFDSHEGFTKAFARQFGLTPRDYAKLKPDVKLFFARSGLRSPPE